MSADILHPLPLPIFGVLLGAALLTDIFWLRIPNWIVMSLVAAFGLTAGLSAHAGDWWISHFAAGLLVLAAGFALFAWGKIGGGDAKLMAAIGLWAGLSLLPSLLFSIAIVNGAVILAYMAARPSGIGPYLESRGLHVASLMPGRDMPFAVAAAAGCWIYLSDFPH